MDRSLHREGARIEAQKYEEYSETPDLVEGGPWPSFFGSDPTELDCGKEG